MALSLSIGTTDDTVRQGGQKKNWDGRPPVIMEAMEGIGQGVYLRRIQDKIAEYGVCCVYEASSDVLITQGPRQVQAPLELGAEEVQQQCC